MKKRPFISTDSDYFKYNEEVIKVESCPKGQTDCDEQLTMINRSLVLARKFKEDKLYTRAIASIREAFDATFTIKPQECFRCGKFLRGTIINTLEYTIQELKDLTGGLFGNRNYKSDLKEAESLLEELKNRMT